MGAQLFRSVDNRHKQDPLTLNMKLINIFVYLGWLLVFGGG